jgi:hypothetical protein
MVGEPTDPTPLLQLHDWTGEGPGDASHRLHPRDHQLGELVDVAGFGADDHVVGAVTAWACWTPVMSMMSLATLAALPTSVWMRMYGVTTGTDLLASCRPRHLQRLMPQGMVACGGRVRRLCGGGMESTGGSLGEDWQEWRDLNLPAHPFGSRSVGRSALIGWCAATSRCMRTVGEHMAGRATGP